MDGICKTCIMEQRFKYIEKDVGELQETTKETTKDMQVMKESNAETKIYVKQIFEKLETLTKSVDGISTSLTENLKKVTATETTTIKLEADVKAVTEDVKTIKDKPNKSRENTVSIIKAVIITNLISILMTAILSKFIK